MSGIISPEPVTEWLPAHLPAYLSNGLVGMRVGTLPWTRGVTTINGFEGMDTTLDVEAIAQAPYVLGGDLSIGRVTLSESPQRARPHEIRYDFTCGELHTSFHFQPTTPGPRSPWSPSAAGPDRAWCCRRPLSWSTAVVTLHEAAALGRMLGRGSPEDWDGVASQITLPIDQDQGVILNHDGYHPDEKGGETPEAPAGLFLLGFDTDPDTERRTLQFYLKLAHRYAGQPMLSSMLGLIAARLGDRDAALELFERGYADFIVDPFRITAEFSPAVFPDRTIAGPFTANLAGFLTACIYGLTGMKIGLGEPGSWCTRPISMPKGWDGIHVERLWMRGRPASLTAEHGAEHARLAFP